MGIRTHRVQYGDTLASLAKVYYGDEHMYAYIYQHNRHVIAQMNQLQVGQVITIPFLPVRETLRKFL